MRGLCRFHERRTVSPSGNDKERATIDDSLFGHQLKSAEVRISGENVQKKVAAQNLITRFFIDKLN